MLDSPFSHVSLPGIFCAGLRFPNVEDLCEDGDREMVWGFFFFGCATYTWRYMEAQSVSLAHDGGALFWLLGGVRDTVNKYTLEVFGVLSIAVFQVGIRFIQGVRMLSPCMYMLGLRSSLVSMVSCALCEMVSVHLPPLSQVCSVSRKSPSVGSIAICGCGSIAHFCSLRVACMCSSASQKCA